MQPTWKTSFESREVGRLRRLTAAMNESRWTPPPKEVDTAAGRAEREAVVYASRCASRDQAQAVLTAVSVMLASRTAGMLAAAGLAAAAAAAAAQAAAHLSTEAGMAAAAAATVAQAAAYTSAEAAEEAGLNVRRPAAQAEVQAVAAGPPASAALRTYGTRSQDAAARAATTRRSYGGTRSQDAAAPRAATTLRGLPRAVAPPSLAPISAIPLNPQQLANVAAAQLREAQPPGPSPGRRDEIPLELMPGGDHDCGGHLAFPHLTLVGTGKGPLLAMQGGAAVLFKAFVLNHATTRHHTPRKGGGAHLSFVAQTPYSTVVGEQGSMSKAADLQQALSTAAAVDAAELWQDAVWLGVVVHKGAPSHTGHVEFDASTMTALPYQRVVLFDAEVGISKPLVFYDLNGGLSTDEAAAAREQFAFLENHPFTLSRGSASSKTGALSIDGKGSQRMEMCGVRVQGRNVRRPAERKRSRGHSVVNANGDLDVYVVHLDKALQFGARGELKPILNAMSEKMSKMLPTHFSSLRTMLIDHNMPERLRSTAARNVISDDLIVNNYGPSSSYQSPAHTDPNDLGFTTAFAVKCPPACCACGAGS